MLKLADGFPSGESDLQPVPASVGEVGERCILGSPKRPGTIVTDLKVAVDDNHIPVFVWPLHDLPECTQSGAARSGNNQISIEGSHRLTA